MAESDRRVGDYEILSSLGSGGMGRVFKVRNVISNREEAMKILLPDFASDPDLAARFMAEIRTLAGLDHPGIAQLRTAFQYQNQFVMVMEYVEGATLDRLAAQTRIPVDRMLDYASQVLAALSYAHGRGVTHRDIKPSNIMITTHGLVKLMDFGIAKSTNDMQLTRPGTTMGSVYYMSPEQVRSDTVDARSDIYSFGVTLYEMLTGQKPFKADTSYSVLNAQLNQAPTPLIEINPALSPELSGIVLHAMAKKPEDRFQTADEFREAIRGLHRPETAAAPQPGVAQGLAPQASMVIPAMAQAGQHADAATVAPPFGAAQTPPAYAPVAPPPVPAPAAAKSHRGLWLSLGAATAILALVAVAILLPRVLATYAKQKAGSVASEVQAPATQQATPPATQQAPAPPPADSSQEPSPSNDAGAQPATPAPAAATEKPVTPRDSEAQSMTSTTVEKPGKLKAAEASGHIGSHARPAEQAKPREAYVPSASQAVAANSVAAAGGSPSGSAAPSPRDVREAGDRLGNLQARADAALSGVEQIRREQQAQGVDIRSDILSAMNRLQYQLNQSRRALNEKDLATANEYMNRADLETSKLEKFLGH
jgi:eukaryotic-like serine/threonine-protein kinase